jgi:hypothetical protein
MLGQAAIAMWWDVDPAVRAEFEDWHSREHMPERLAIPGFLRGSRWIALSGEPSYFVLYEASGVSVLTSGRYLERLNDPTPWSRKMMPHHRNMVRSVCRVRASFGAGLPYAVATIRFSPGQRSLLPELPQGKGLTGSHLLESQPIPARETLEQKIRGGDATADWVMLIGGYDVEALKAFLAEQSAALHGAQGAIYRLGYSLVAGEH